MSETNSRIREDQTNKRLDSLERIVLAGFAELKAAIEGDKLGNRGLVRRVETVEDTAKTNAENIISLKHKVANAERIAKEAKEIQEDGKMKKLKHDGAVGTGASVITLILYEILQRAF